MFNYAHQYEVCRYHQPDRIEAKLSSPNFKDNHPWGDDLCLAKPPNTFRLYYQNINGIKLDDRGGDLASFLTTFSELQCDVVGLCKIKLDVLKYKVRQIISTAIRQQFKSARHAATTSPIPFETDYKPGSMMTMSFGSPVSRFQSKYEDPLGRWSTLSFNAKKGMVVHFITVYQDVHKPTGGPYTAYQQQRASLLLDDRDLLPRQAFLMDFDKYLHSLDKTESQFVVMGDFNEVVGRNASGFAKITTSFQLVDVLSHFHSVQTEVPTYARGSERLDYVFCSVELLPAVAHCGAEPFNQHIFSDHRALFIDWHEDILFGSKCPLLVSHAQRRFLSKHRPSVTKYIEELHKYSIDHNILARLGKLSDNPNPLIAEKIDRDITRGMLIAESRCRHPGSDPWSPVLKEPRLLVDIFKHALSMVRIGVESRYKLQRLLSQYAIPIDVPDTQADIQSALRIAQTKLRTVQKEAAEHRKSFLLKRASEAAMLQQAVPLQAAKRLAKAEEMKALHAKLRFISRDSDQQSGLTSLQVPQNPSVDPKMCSEWKTVDTPEEITSYL
jgi:exonuclease III